MSLFQAVILGIIQGATEFLPVSSSGHLVLVPWWLGWDVSYDLVFTIATHMGTLCAVLIYFREDWVNVLRGGWRILKTHKLDDVNSRLFIFLIIGSIPTAIVGTLFKDAFEAAFETPVAAAAFLFLTALLLVLSEQSTNGGNATRNLQQLTWKDSLTIGTAQVVALLPGVSRSGSTIAAGLFTGITRADAARFSFLLGTPAILGAGLFTSIQMAVEHQITNQLPTMLVGFASAAVVGYGAIAFLLNHLRKHQLYAFAIYCTLVGVVSLSAAIIGR